MRWDDYFFSMIPVIAEKSKDRSSKVGCVIVGPDNEIRSTGFNGFSRGVNDDKDERHERPAKYLFTEHAERNAIYNAARHGTPLKGCRIYQDWIPCARCARAIIQAGLVEVVVDGRDYEKKKAYWDERWKEECECAREMLKEARVLLRFSPPAPPLNMNIRNSFPE